MRGDRHLVCVLLILVALQIVSAAGGGGGGSGSGRTSKYTFTSTLDERTATLQNGQTYTFQMENRNSFQLTMEDVERDFIEFSVDGAPPIRVEKGTLVFVDANGNGLIDFSAQFNSVQYSLANVLVTDLKDDREVAVFEGTGPVEVEPYQLQCDGLGTIRERVRCRLSLDEADFVEEAAGSIHEECRALEGGERHQCVVRYERIAKCYDLSVGEARFICGRNELGITSVRDERAACGDDACLVVLREKVFHMVKFRFYDLEERAEHMLEDGADVGVVSEFVAGIAEAKIAFNDAESIAAKKEIVLGVRELWREFLREVNGV